MNAVIRFAAGALVTVAFGSAAAAQDQYGVRVVGSGENASMVYSGPSANIVGGARTRVVGYGESAQTVVDEVQYVQPSRVARVVGSGENMSIVYDDVAPTSLMAKSGQQD
ncbi:hypothetical protein [Roseomonas sp. AR75]|uniref:hypothetical protein n=1 Tax=Roseomonas sp. AR75 TaxID=2562311 RepID=UPI0010BFBDB8|nr:hypothetical protein [Roseomonas sp. AR75]